MIFQPFFGMKRDLHLAVRAERMYTIMCISCSPGRLWHVHPPHQIVGRGLARLRARAVVVVAFFKG